MITPERSEVLFVSRKVCDVASFKADPRRRDFIPKTVPLIIKRAGSDSAMVENRLYVKWANAPIRASPTAPSILGTCHARHIGAESVAVFCGAGENTVRGLIIGIAVVDVVIDGDLKLLADIEIPCLKQSFRMIAHLQMLR
jgi:hypothetical protein